MRIFPLLAFLIGPSLANAALIITAEEVGTDLLVNASGNINLSALSFISSGNGAGTISPSSGNVLLGPAFVGFEEYTGISGPSSFGPGFGPGFPTTGSGGLVGVLGSNGFLRVPSGYSSGDLISAAMTYSNNSLDNLGITRGNYVWTWGAGTTADSLTFQAGSGAVPAPPTLALLGLGGLLVARWRRPPKPAM
jgi:hypothetical protein